ncbi:aspartate/glutamate racemase family protein [Loktanella sp. F6476L]|uniref:aspartate/glutamate racemase family protein n=1 Tax=Loktanella sp. F6476L TaxID=2926405 RepID=UPI001FF4FC57|nr:aspartate/glutamate racemase family protein [Loktanella sp. F6476L]MCK0118923.1 aspartate/glutamate racemase family protein [Loktanella sp. F6476L]
MTPSPRIALIHATRVAIEPVETAAASLWPEAETISILEEGLSVDRSKAADLSKELSDRIKALSHYAQAAHADGILFTCSAFGTAIAQANAQTDIPVMNPNEAMFDAALSQGEQIAMIYTFQPAADGMEEEFRETAAARGIAARITSYFCDGALDAKRAGDNDRHNQLIAQTAAEIEGADVILLAQFSMAGAAETVRQSVTLPVLTSPESAIQEMRRRIATK